MKDFNIIRTGKYISKLLRHDPEDLVMDVNGWVLVKDLIIKTKISKEILDSIVISDNKTRFSYNDTKTKIRANQGHSIDVDVELEEVIPPDTLYHGTSSKVLDIIMENGLIGMTRKYVHLSIDEETAVVVGNRHTKTKSGVTVLLKINTKKLHEDGHKVFKSKNNVYLMDKILPEYISVDKYIEK